MFGFLYYFLLEMVVSYSQLNLHYISFFGTVFRKKCTVVAHVHVNMSNSTHKVISPVKYTNLHTYFHMWNSHEGIGIISWLLWESTFVWQAWLDSIYVAIAPRGLETFVHDTITNCMKIYYWYYAQFLFILILFKNS